MAVREEAQEDELERVALADDRPLDLVEHEAGQLVDAVEVHAHRRSRDSTTRRRSLIGSPRPGGPRAAGGRAHELPGRLSEQARARSGAPSSETPRRAASRSDGEPAQARAKAVVEVERAGDAEGRLLLEAPEHPGIARLAVARARRRPQRRLARDTRGAAPREHDEERSAAQEEREDPEREARAAGSERDDEDERERREGEQARRSPEVVPHEAAACSAGGETASSGSSRRAPRARAARPGSRRARRSPAPASARPPGAGRTSPSRRGR